MTTIAFKDGVLAADSLMTCGNTVEGHVRKVWSHKGVLISACGPYTLAQAFVGWVRDGMKDKSPYHGSDEGNGYVVRPDGLSICFAKDGAFKLPDGPWASGSGFEIALGALDAGKTAEEAVEIASRRNVYSGGPVQSVRLVMEDK